MFCTALAMSNHDLLVFMFITDYKPLKSLNNGLVAGFKVRL